MKSTETGARATLLTTCLGRLSDAGKPGRILSLEADLLRSSGPAALEVWRERTRDLSWGPRVRRNVYGRIWADAAAELGADVVPLGGDFLRLRRGTDETTVWFHHVMLDNAVHIQLALNKGIVQRLLSEAGVRVTSYAEFDATDEGVALAFMAERGGAFVVKPADTGSGGQGVTCGIDTVDRFARARLWARRWDRRLIIEQQVQGDEYRFLFLDGSLLGIIRRRPLRLTGDGRSSVIELLAAENRRRADTDGSAGMGGMLVDLDCLLALERCGLSLRSVPREGESIVVKATVSWSGAAETETIPESAVGRELLADAATAAGAIGLRLGSVELITPDPTRSLDDGRGAVLEVNGTPGLHYHYLVSQAVPPDRVAVPVLARLFGIEAPAGWRHDQTRPGAGSADVATT